MNILVAAAENAALPEGKVGGVADVVRDLPPALAGLGCRVTVVTPSHGFLHLAAGARKRGSCRFLFRGMRQTAEIFKANPIREDPGVTHLVIHHPAMSAFDPSAGTPRIYAHDPPDRPFSTDGSRFALFCAAVAGAAAAEVIGPFDVVHLHDWHAALLLLLWKFHPDYRAVGKPRSVFSIHNLAFQGIRPLRGDESSLEAWFPELIYDWRAVADPRWPECVNPMAVGIRLADRVHTVSPSYAEEIRLPDLKPQFHGGEGLESELNRAHREGRLKGILNGCRYPAAGPAPRIGFEELLRRICRDVTRWCGDADEVPAAHFIAMARCLELSGRADRPDPLLTAVGRVGEQKMLLLRRRASGGKPALEAVLEALGERGCFVLLGSGDRDYERFLTRVCARHDNFIFVNGFSDPCAEALYRAGDLFLMPSSFEPCGLGQMLAMREGQPCLVHAVGGLKDTVEHGRNGFVFSGDTVEQQVDRFVTSVSGAVALKRESPHTWEEIRRNAAAARFTWEDAAEQYVRELYNRPQ